MDATTYLGKTIKEVVLGELDRPAWGLVDALILEFTDGTKLAVFDAGQSCCESRFITCDDDLQTLVGHRLVNIEEKPGPDLRDELCDVHETAFVEIKTKVGFVTLTTHNEHNGYYGGFYLQLQSL